jgi:hypothetical protein
VTYLFAPELHNGDGFVLRSYNSGDGSLLSEASNESYEHLRPWMPWATPHLSAEDAEQLVRRFRARYLLAEDFVLGIFSSDQKRLLGSTGFHLREGPSRQAAPRWACSSARPKQVAGLGPRF